MGHYRLFIIALCALLTVALQLILSRTRFGSRLRAAVDDPRVAAGLGINVNVVFLLDLRRRLRPGRPGRRAGRRDAGLDPTFPLKYMIYFLIVVSVGGTSSITGPLLAALLLGIADVAGKYFIPKTGRLHRLRADDRDPDVAAARPVHAQGRQVMQRCHRQTPRRAAATVALARVGAAAVAARLRRAAAAAEPGAADQRDRHRRAVRDVARPDPGLHRHRLARPCGVLRLRRLRRRAVRQARDARPAGRPAGRHGAVGAAGRAVPASPSCAAPT